MKVLALDINGFRGIQKARIVFPENGVLVGPNGAGKSTVIDALSLAFGRNRLVRELTEHDFHGSSPDPNTRIRIVVTLGGFPSLLAEEFPAWFRHDRGVPKWWRATDQDVSAEPHADGCELCVQIGFAARFDHEELAVDQIRYFHDDEDSTDPFLEDAVVRFPRNLLNEIGFFVLPANRTWASSISFGSELFRKAVATVGGLPAAAVRNQLQDLRSPENPMEADDSLAVLVRRIDSRMGQFLPGKPRLQLRLTSTDSDSLLKALIPHYEFDGGAPLPAVRHGTGLVSLQTLALLLEIGRSRVDAGLSFILAVEEPELHVPPGLQRRLLGEAVGVANQTICTTHSPRVASLFDARQILILARRNDDDGQEATGGEEDGKLETVLRLEGRRLAPDSMIADANPLAKLYTEHRARLVEALMFPFVLVPEGRTDFGWLQLLLDASETSASPLGGHVSSFPPYGATVGVVPTQSSEVKGTFERLRSLHDRVAVLVDGDAAGDEYIRQVLRCDPPPVACIQWPAGWTIERVIQWILEAQEDEMLAEVNSRLDRAFGSIQELTTAMQDENGRTGGLKQFMVAHEEIAGAMKLSAPCVARIDLLLQGITRAVMGELDTFPHMVGDARTTENCPVMRFRP